MTLRIGVAGLRRGGGPANVFHHHRDCELAAIADRNTTLLDAVGDKFGIDKSMRFDDIQGLYDSALDAIFVATPAPLHAQQAVASLRAGKHVLSEVPAVFGIDEGRELVKAVRETGLKYSFAENMCYFPYVLHYRQLLEEGQLGEVTYAEAEYIHNCENLMVSHPDGMGGGEDGKPTWRAKMPPIQYCTHDLGPLLQMFDDRCLTAVGMHTGSRRRKDLGVIDMEVGIFKTANDILIKILCGFSVAKEPAHHWFTIYGTEGHLEQSRLCAKPGVTTHRLYREKYPRLGAPVTFEVPSNDPSAPAYATLGGHGTSEYYMVDEFVQCILKDTKPPIDVYEALDWALPGICAHLSAENGSQPVEVPDPRGW